jgi:glyoxylase-like metal-dependent hydrolase (beta-lactamase superfamily II)
MRLPKEKIVFAVDFAPVGSVPGRGMIDFYPLEAEDSIKRLLAMDWERLIPGHPGAPGGRLGTKKDVQDQLELLQHASETVKTAARAGKCWEPAEKEVKLPKYESWPGYETNLPFVIRRYCGLWGRGT